MKGQEKHPGAHPDINPGRLQGKVRETVKETVQRKELFARIGDKTAELVALTQDLVRFPTVNPPGDAYAGCAVFIGKWLGARGWAVRYIRGEGAPGDSNTHPRVNVIARKQGSNTHKGGPCIHFNGHTDVVEAGAGWSKSAFEPCVHDGKIYGRGTCDMKGGIAASMIAADAIFQSGIPFNGAIEISGTVDEESGGYAGVAYLAERGHFSKPNVDHVIIPEPLGVDRICLGHRGVWWAEIQTHGRIAHGSMPFLGNCAVRHMGALMSAFETELWPKLAQKRTAMPVVPDAARQATLNIAEIHGGLPEKYEGLPSPNVPHACKMMIDRRFLPEEPLEQVKQEVTDILQRLSKEREGFSYSLRDVMEVMPSLTPESSGLVRSLGQSINAVLAKQPTHICSPGTYDQKHIQRIGNLQDCVAYGPGILELAHQPDEFVVIDDLVNSAKVMALSALQLCGVSL